MKFIRLTTVYNLYLTKLYRNNPSLSKLSYDKQLKSIHDDRYAWSDVWKISLEPHGYEVTEIIANIEPLQKSWAYENNFNYKSNNWLLDIAAEQIKILKPDVIFLDDFNTFPVKWLLELREQNKSIKLVIGWCGAPYDNIEVFRGFDMVLSNIKPLVDQFNKFDIKSHYLAHAFDKRVLEYIENTKKSIEFSFVGQLSNSSNTHIERRKFIKYLLENTALEIYSPSGDMEINFKYELYMLLCGLAYDVTNLMRRLGFSDQTISNIPKLDRTINWKERPKFSLLNKIRDKRKIMSKPSVFGLDMYSKLASSKITFNNHINFSGDYASNMRLFEATGVGTCLLTDWKSNIAELFEPDKEIVTYKTQEECSEKVNWLLEHPDSIDSIAKAGQQRTLSFHNFEDRAARFNEIIRASL